MTITVIDEKPDVRKAEDYFKQAIETSLVNTFPKDSQVQMDFRETGSIPQITTISGYDAQNIYTVMPEETDMPEYSLGFSAVVERAGQDLGMSIKTIPDGGQIWLGQIQTKIGDWTGSEEFKKSGLLNIQSANRNLEKVYEDFYTNEVIPLTQEQLDSFTYKLASTGAQYAPMIALGMVNPSLAYAYMGALVGSESAIKGLEAYKQQNPEDKELKGFAEQSLQEIGVNIVQVAKELLLEKYVGGFEKTLNIAKAGRFATGGALKGAVRAGVKSGLSEFLTETSQNVSEVGIDWLAGRIDNETAIKDIQQAILESVAAGVFGGAVGGAGFVLSRPQAVAKIEEQLVDIIPDEQERQATARSIYDNEAESLTERIGIELEQSSQLRTKHGEIYESMKREVANLVKDSGAFADKSEAEVASYIESESKRFADNVLAEANKRKVWIDDVIKASDIVEKDGRLYLQGEYFGNPTGKLGEKQALYQKDRYIKGESSIQNLYDIHKDIAEELPENYSGSRKKEDVLRYLGSKDGKSAKIQTPLESVIFNNNIIHLLEENNNERLEDLNRVVRTLKNPSLVISNIENETEFHYYIKVFRNKNKSIGHLQIIKYKPDGAFYVTNHRLKSRKFDKIINSGRIILDASTPTAIKESPLSVRSIITQNTENVKSYSQTDVKNLPREKKITRGEFDALTKSIKLYEDANFSTLPHELAHFWLDNIWNYTQSGLASPEYMAQFNDVKKWLGIKDNQRFILPKQHEEFARAYEKYLVNGQYPSEAVKGAFNDYDNWIKSVYNTMRDVDINAGQKKYRPLSRKMFDFFDSMTTGELIAPTNLEERTPEENVKYVEKEVEKAREVIKKDQEQLEENRKHTLMPVQTNTKTGYLTAYEKMTGEKVEAGSIDTKIEFNRAKELVDNNPTLVKDIVEGRAEAPQGYVKNLIYQAYAEQQKKLGNTKERDIAMLNQALELRRMGQEIASQQNQYKNPFEKLASPLNWILDVLGNKQALLADKAKKTTEEVNKIIEKQVRDGIKENKSVKQIVNDTVEALGLPTTFKQETVEELYPASYESNITAYNEIYKAVNKALGNSLTEQEVDEITRRADEMLTNLENSMDDEGNPSIEYWQKLSDMENYANSLAPSPVYRIFTDVIGPANLMSSTKTLGFNIEANIPTAIVKAGVRRAVIGQSTSIVDKDLVKQYKARSREIFKRTGYNISSMDIKDASDVGRTILGEKIIHTQGKTYGTGLEKAKIHEKAKYLLTGEYKGLKKATSKERLDYAFRGLAREYEKIIYKLGLGWGDIVFKDFAFADHVALEASKQANGDVAKANAIFKDATRVLPETELGQEIRQRAIADALISTYQNRGKLSDLSLKVRNAIDEFFPGLGKLLITFAKTPANVVGMSLETSFAPVIMMKDIASDIVKNKGLKLNDTTKSKLVSLGSQFGITTILTMLLAYGLFDDDDYMPDYDLASQREKEIARELNIPYNSVRIGDKWVSLEAFGPLAGMFSGIMAGKRAESISDWLLRYSRSAGIQSFTIPVWGGFKEATDVGSMLIKGDVEETARKASESLANTVYSRTFPSIIADITKAFDPYERETEKSGFKKIGAKIPFVRTMLDEKVNVTTGMPEKRAQSDIQRVLMDLFAGSRLKEQVVNPIADELLRLAQKDEGVSLTGITYRGDLSKVLPEYKQKVREDFAKLYSKRVGALIKTDGYKRKTDEEKKESINAIRRAIVKELKGKYKGYIKK